MGDERRRRPSKRATKIVKMMGLMFIPSWGIDVNFRVDHFVGLRGSKRLVGDLRCHANKRVVLLLGMALSYMHSVKENYDCTEQREESTNEI